jgi:hypothetical protein
MASASFPNDEITESALGIMAFTARDTIHQLDKALASMRKVADRAEAALERGLHDGDMSAIKSETLKAAYAQFLAREQGGKARDQVLRLITHQES